MHRNHQLICICCPISKRSNKQCKLEQFARRLICLGVHESAILRSANNWCRKERNCRIGHLWHNTKDGQRFAANNCAPNWIGLNPADYKCWVRCSQLFYTTTSKLKDYTFLMVKHQNALLNLKSAWQTQNQPKPSWHGTRKATFLEHPKFFFRV
jgi:hypothetical protein